MTTDDEIERPSAPEQKTQKKRTIAPATRAPELWQFLEHQHWGEEQNSVDKVTLCAVYGAVGMRMGPVIREWSFAPPRKKTEASAPVASSKLSKERLIELSNEILQLAEIDCDALGKPTRYAVLAWDQARSDRPIGRHLLRLSPSGMRTPLEEERGMGEEEDESRPSATLLLNLLAAEQRDKRWMSELAMNVLSGAAERDAQRIERLEQLADGAVAKQVALLDAIEKTLSGAAERKAKAEWQLWKQQKIDLALEKVFALGEVLLPAALAGKSGATTAANPIRTFMASVSEQQGELAFGKFRGDNFSDPGARLTQGVFTDEQLQMLMSLAAAPEPDMVTVDKFIATVRQEQIARARDIFADEQLMPLMKFLAARAPRASSP